MYSDNRTKNLIVGSIKRLAVVSLFFASFLLAANSAHAISIDYANLANTSPGEGGYASFTPAAVDGITVTATATNIAGNINYYAYLDSTWDTGGGGGLGGLGVCKDLFGDSVPDIDGSDCNPSSDDNLTAGEMLTLDFSEEVIITQILFRDGEHWPSFSYPNNDFDLYIDLDPAISYPLVHEFNTILTGTRFSFVTSTGGTDVDELYIQMITFTPVPEPSTYLLLGSGLLALASWRRRTKR
ncbi:MAG: PEP-CTERM sorting domain-containing protein [Thermodesulfobacteriota bacterium]